MTLTSPPILYIHERIKHVKVDSHPVRQECTSKKITLPYIRPKDQVVDLFTKAQTTTHFWQFLSKLFLFDLM